MAAGGVGYWHANYWHTNYWHTEYWTEDASDPVAAGAPGGGMNLAVLEELMETAVIIAFIMLGL